MPITIDDTYLATITNEHTRRNYRSVINRWVNYCHDYDIPVDQHSALRFAKKTANNGTYNVRISAMKSYLEWLHEPVDAFRFRDYKAPRQPVVPWEKKAKIIAQAKTLEERVLLYLLLHTMMRWEGVRNLKWSGVHVDDNDLETVEKRSVERTRSSKFGSVKMTKECAAELTKWRAARNPNSSDPVILMDYRTALRVVQRCLDDAGIIIPKSINGRKAGIHAMRRGSASGVYARLEGKTPREMMKGLDELRRILSHSQLSTTMGYLYADEKESREFYDQVMRDDDV